MPDFHRFTLYMVFTVFRKMTFFVKNFRKFHNFCDFPSKMKVLKFLGLQPTYNLDFTGSNRLELDRLRLKWSIFDRKGVILGQNLKFHKNFGCNFDDYEGSN